MVAYADDEGNPLGEKGFAIRIVPGDKHASRPDTNIVGIEVHSVRGPAQAGADFEGRH